MNNFFSQLKKLLTVVDLLKCLSNLAFCFLISSACSSFEATGADELKNIFECFQLSVFQ